MGGEGLRYKFQHLGDIVADKLEAGCRATKSSTRGVVLTYDLCDLRKKKRKVVGKIGARLVQIRKESPELDVFQNEKMMEVFNKLAKLEDREEAIIQERLERLKLGGKAFEAS